MPATPAGAEVLGPQPEQPLHLGRHVVAGEVQVSADRSVVLLQHLEGSEWSFLAISRYNSWQEFATNESNAVADAAKGQGGWFKLRDLIAAHADTVTVRVAP